MKGKITVILTLLLITGAATAQKSVKLELDKKKTEPAPLRTSEYADIWLELRNNGNRDAENVVIKFQENYPFSADPDEKTTWEVGSLVPGEEHQIHLQARVNDNAVQGENELKFETKTSNNISVTHKIPVEVRSDNDILSIAEVNISEDIAPGSREDLHITFENLADGQLKNIEINLDLSKMPLATSESTTRTITSISPSSSHKASYSLKVDENAENGVYKIPVTYNYENEAGTEFSKESSIGVSVGGQPQLETSLNSVEETLTPGATGKIALRIVNRGRGSADFVKINLKEGNSFEILSPNSVYLGGMDSDDFQTAEFEIHVDKNTSDLSIPVEILYKKGSDTVTETESVELPIYSQKELKKYGMAGNGNPIPLVVILLVVGAGIYYWRRKRK